MKLPTLFDKARTSFLLVWKSTPGKVGISISAVIVLIAIFAPFIAPYPPNKPNVGPHYGGISSSHLLGTDDIGEDIFSQLTLGFERLDFCRLFRRSNFNITRGCGGTLLRVLRREN